MAWQKSKEYSKSSVYKFNSEMKAIFDSWDYQIYEQLEKVDHFFREMTKEMHVYSIPEEIYIPFLKERLNDMLQQIAERYNDRET